MILHAYLTFSIQLACYIRFSLDSDNWFWIDLREERTQCYKYQTSSCGQSQKMSVPIKRSTDFYWEASVHLAAVLNLALYLATSIPSHEIFFLFLQELYNKLEEAVK